MVEESELRETVARIVHEEAREGDEDHWTTHEFEFAVADRILSIPRIAEALAKA